MTVGPPRMRRWQWIGVVLAIAGCGMIPSREPVSAQRVYLLEPLAATASGGGTRGGQRRCGNLLVQPVTPAPGFLTSRMLYRRYPHQLEQFAFSRWADTPAQMLTPHVVAALASAERFDVVATAPAPIDHDLLLSLGSLTVLQVVDETTSEIELGLEAVLFAPASRRQLGRERLTIVEPASAASPEAGVDAASRAVSRLLDRLVDFVVTRTGETPDLCAG